MGCLVGIPCLFLQGYSYSIRVKRNTSARRVQVRYESSATQVQDEYKSDARQIRVKRKLGTRQVQDKHKTTQPFNTNVSATLSKNPTVFDQIPTRRGAAYQKVGISRAEGARLCSFLGYGLRQPLTSSQLNRLLELAQLFQPWKEKGFSVNTFLTHYSSEES